MKSKDTSTYQMVIGASETNQLYNEMIPYLLMVREQVKDMVLDNALVYAYAKTEKLVDLEQFVSNANSVDAQKVGDRCYDEKLYEAAKILFISIKNNAKISSCLVRLKQFN